MKLLPVLVILALLSGCAADKGPPDLRASSWQLVRIHDGSGAVLVPDVKAKYTMEFDALGRVRMRIDCNRASGKWASPAPGRLEFSELAMTRAACPPGSLHDRIVRELGNVRSYTVKDNQLFLSLMADGSSYQFEPR